MRWPRTSCRFWIESPKADAVPWVALRHVVNHTSYHRGRVGSKLKPFGVQQPETELVLRALEQGRSRKDCRAHESKLKRAVPLSEFAFSINVYRYRPKDAPEAAQMF